MGQRLSAAESKRKFENLQQCPTEITSHAPGQICITKYLTAEQAADRTVRNLECLFCKKDNT